MKNTDNRLMDTKNYAEVLIDGKIYTLGGAEDENYLQRVASYINEKTAQMKRQEGFSKQSQEYQAVMIELNLADDYFKAKKQGSSLETDIESKDKEMYDLKHDLISVQIKLENAEKAMDRLKEENKELQMKIVKLETEMKNKRK